MVGNLDNIIIIVDIQPTIIPLQPRLISSASRARGVRLAICHSMALNPGGSSIGGLPSQRLLDKRGLFGTGIGSRLGSCRVDACFLCEVEKRGVGVLEVEID
ncbi:hypothetical protein HG531_014090 [Fusarium graminearum]|nr:hypothetical protein HG531_014090 [Fusarium graminearum]